MKENTKIILVAIIAIVVSSTISITATTMIQANSVSYKTSNGDTTDVNSALDRLFDLNTVNQKIGSTNISSIGNGTITGAISELKSNLSDISSRIDDRFTWKYVGSANGSDKVSLPSSFNEILVQFRHSVGANRSATVLPYIMLSDDEQMYVNGYDMSSSGYAGWWIMATTSYVYCSNFISGGTGLLSKVTIDVYYR
jgi:hypothetical protein